MSQFLGFFVLAGVYLLGKVIVLTFAVPVPGALVGLLLLLLFLLFKQSVPFMVNQGAAPLLNHMTVLFVPAISAVVLFWDDISQHVVAMTAALLGSTIVSLAIAAWFAQVIFARGEEK